MQTNTALIIVGSHREIENQKDKNINNSLLLARRLGCSHYRLLEDPTVTNITWNLKELLPKVAVEFIYVGHGTKNGVLSLKNGEVMSPEMLFTSLLGCSGLLKFHLFSCYSHEWMDAANQLKSWRWKKPTIIFSTISTQSESDEINDKIFAYRTQLISKRPTQVSFGNATSGHFNLASSSQYGHLCCALPWHYKSLCLNCGKKYI